MISGLIYLLASFAFGFWLTSFFLKPIKNLAKLAASYLLGYFLSGWLTFVFSLIFSQTEDPLRWGIYGAFGAIFLISLALIKKLSLADLKFKISQTEFIFLVFSLVFSFWIMGKSFGYDKQGYFKIASNIFDDFNIHLGIIRSFSWGKNFLPELPFFSGVPMRYHFMADFTFAIFEFLGWNMGWAINIPSALAFTSLLVLIYCFSQELFGKNILIGFISVGLYLFNSSLTWTKLKSLDQILKLGEYLSAGPFDKGVISIFWNLNTYLNQRHLIFSLGLFLAVSLVLLDVWKNKKPKLAGLIFTGCLVGLLPLWHGLVFVATIIVVLGFWLLAKFKKEYFYVLAVAFFFFLVQFLFLLGPGSGVPFLRPGFLAAGNLTPVNFFTYWFFNLGLSWIIIFAGFLFSSPKQRQFYLPFLGLFIIGNVFQFSRNMFHNHSLFNIWIIISNFYSAYFLANIFRKKWEFKLLGLVFLFFLTFSGVIDLFVIKNDFIHKIADIKQSKIIKLIEENTSPHSVYFTGEEELYSPAILAGRRIYLGASHFVWGYGYPINERKTLTIKVANNDNKREALKILQDAGIDYWLEKHNNDYEIYQVTGN